MRRKQKRERIGIGITFVVSVLLLIGLIVGHMMGCSVVDEEDTGTTRYESVSKIDTSELCGIEERLNLEEDEETEIRVDFELVGVETEVDIEQQIDQRTQEIVNSMTLEEKVAQMFFLTPEALTGYTTVIATGDVTKQALDQYPVGGLVYFATNLQEPQQTKDMLYGVQEYVTTQQEIPLFLGVDEEGGRVRRIGNNDAFDVENVEAMGVLAQKRDTQVIYDAGDTIGNYLSELGFNVNFAPDADVLINSENSVIGDRSFGSNPIMVAEMARAYMEGLHANSVLATYKHFPGHGRTVEDSHEGHAYLYATLEELEQNELVPFVDGSSQGVDFIMVSHISVPEIIGDNTPASLSKVMVTDILRNELNYQGIIITDSLSMGAICDYYSTDDAVVLAVQAGNDMLLMPQDFTEAYNALLTAVDEGKITEERINESIIRIVRAKLTWQENRKKET